MPPGTRRTMAGMPRQPDSSVGAVTAASDALLGTGIAVITVGAVLALLLVIGFAVLVRRGRASRRGATRQFDDAGLRADVALVRLDDLVTESADELAFAEAQFDDTTTRPLAGALAAARSNLTAAFRLKQQLDDTVADSATQVREWTATILMLCETSTERLTAERSVMDGLRTLERSAPGQAESLRRSLDDTLARVAAAEDIVASLKSGYAVSAVSSVLSSPVEATALLESARVSLDDADRALAEDGFASGHLDSAASNIERAGHLLDGVQERDRALAAASGRLLEVLSTTRTALGEARRVRDRPPDPTTGAAVGAAVVVVEQALAAADRRNDADGGATVGPDPDASRARIEAAVDALDSALAGARTQRQRLEHAAEARDGALLTAQSQFGTTRAYIAASHGGVGAEARTRLAEAERLLAVAEAESDPVIALDTARRSATYSRDADALARFARSG